MCSNARQVAGLRFGGIEDGLKILQGVFRHDLKDPEANGRPHYSTLAGSHLYYSKSGKWLLNDGHDGASSALAVHWSVPIAAC